MAMVRPIAMKFGMVMQLHPLNPASPVFPNPNALVAVGNSGLSVCQRLGMSVTLVSPAKMAEPIEMPLG